MEYLIDIEEELDEDCVDKMTYNLYDFTNSKYFADKISAVENADIITESYTDIFNNQFMSSFCGSSNWDNARMISHGNRTLVSLISETNVTSIENQVTQYLYKCFHTCVFSGLDLTNNPSSSIRYGYLHLNSIMKSFELKGNADMITILIDHQMGGKKNLHILNAGNTAALLIGEDGSYLRLTYKILINHSKNDKIVGKYDHAYNANDSTYTLLSKSFGPYLSENDNKNFSPSQYKIELNSKHKYIVMFNEMVDNSLSDQMISNYISKSLKGVSDDNFLDEASKTIVNLMNISSADNNDELHMIIANI